MRFDILTLFPAMFTGPLTESILKRAQQAGTIQIAIHTIREFATDRHRTADDAPYGGGAGMVMKAEPLAAAIRHTQAQAAAALATAAARPPVVLLSPDGERFRQELAEDLAQHPGLILVCGHYEGIDERLRQTLVDREVSIGDYVLTGGELAAMVLVDAVARLVPGVLDPASIQEESHSDGLLEYPHYTRPAVWEGQPVPPVLLSGHHGAVASWRRQQRLVRTWQRRPDMLAWAAHQGHLSAADQRFLVGLGWQPEPADDHNGETQPDQHGTDE